MPSTAQFVRDITPAQREYIRLGSERFVAAGHKMPVDEFRGAHAFGLIEPATDEGRKGALGWEHWRPSEFGKEVERLRSLITDEDLESPDVLERIERLIATSFAARHLPE